MKQYYVGIIITCLIIIIFGLWGASIYDKRHPSLTMSAEEQQANPPPQYYQVTSYTDNIGCTFIIFHNSGAINALHHPKCQNHN